VSATVKGKSLIALFSLEIPHIYFVKPSLAHFFSEHHFSWACGF